MLPTSLSVANPYYHYACVLSFKIIKYKFFDKKICYQCFNLLAHRYAQTQPRTVAGGLRPHLSKAGLRPEPCLEQLESAEQIDSFGEIDCGFYLERYVPAHLLVCLFYESVFLVPD